MQEFAHVTGGIVRERISLPEKLRPGIDIFTSDFAAGLVACDATVETGDLYADGVFTKAPPPPVLAPATVSSAQAKITLSRAGKLDAVIAAVAASEDPEVKIWFSDARQWDRTNRNVVAFGIALGLSEAEVDALFAAASLIEG